MEKDEETAYDCANNYGDLMDMNIKQLLGAISAMIIKTAAAAAGIVVVFKLAVAAYDFGYQVFADIPVSDGDGRVISVVVSEKQSSRELAKVLEQRGLINYSYVFFIQEQLSDDYRGNIRPGTYELSTSMSSEQMLEILCHVDEDKEGKEGK